MNLVMWVFNETYIDVTVSSKQFGKLYEQLAFIIELYLKSFMSEQLSVWKVIYLNERMNEWNVLYELLIKHRLLWQYLENSFKMVRYVIIDYYGNSFDLCKKVETRWMLKMEFNMFRFLLPLWYWIYTYICIINTRRSKVRRLSPE